mmetsp:Transcript_6737/g.18003  ORF Transcript_6737/g.18003 Transcript_6737/m.18003 type:complete len:225 (-) Transcript_6737:56-730(-)
MGRASSMPNVRGIGFPSASFFCSSSGTRPALTNSMNFLFSGVSYDRRGFSSGSFGMGPRRDFVSFFRSDSPIMPVLRGAAGATSGSAAGAGSGFSGSSSTMKPSAKKTMTTVRLPSASPPLPLPFASSPPESPLPEPLRLPMMSSTAELLEALAGPPPVGAGGPPEGASAGGPVPASSSRSWKYAVTAASISPRLLEMYLAAVSSEAPVTATNIWTMLTLSMAR